VKQPLATGFTGLDHLWLPRTVLATDLWCPCPR
jgi:hypothetical protein